MKHVCAVCRRTIRPDENAYAVSGDAGLYCSASCLAKREEAQPDDPK